MIPPPQPTPTGRRGTPTPTSGPNRNIEIDECAVPEDSLGSVARSHMAPRRELTVELTSVAAPRPRSTTASVGVSPQRRRWRPRWPHTNRNWSPRC